MAKLNCYPVDDQSVYDYMGKDSSVSPLMINQYMIIWAKMKCQPFDVPYLNCQPTSDLYHMSK